LIREILLETDESESGSFTVSYWKVDPGERVVEGDELLIVESADDKTALAVTSRYTGTLVEILVREEDTVAPGDTLGRIEVE